MPSRIRPGRLEAGQIRARISGGGAGGSAGRERWQKATSPTLREMDRERSDPACPAAHSPEGAGPASIRALACLERSSRRRRLAPAAALSAAVWHQPGTLAMRLGRYGAHSQRHAPQMPPQAPLRVDRLQMRRFPAGSAQAASNRSSQQQRLDACTQRVPPRAGPACPRHLRPVQKPPQPVMASRSPRLKLAPVAKLPVRIAARKCPGRLFQAPPRITRRLQSPAVHALPSVGALR